MKIQNWKNNFLSKARKEVLIKYVLKAIPTYTMSVFKLSKRLCTKIEVMISRFWCCYNHKEKVIHWWKLDILGIANAKGGMGFREFDSFNWAMLARQGWRMLKDPQSFVVKVYKAKYFKNSQLLEASLGKSPLKFGEVFG